MENTELTKMTFELPTNLHTALKKVAAERRTTVKALLIKCATQTVGNEYQRSETSKGDILQEEPD